MKQFASYFHCFSWWQACDSAEINKGQLIEMIVKFYPTFLIQLQALLKVYGQARVLLSPILEPDTEFIVFKPMGWKQERLVISVVWSRSFFEGPLRRRNRLLKEYTFLATFSKDGMRLVLNYSQVSARHATCLDFV